MNKTPDLPAVHRAKTALRAAGLFFRQPTPYQLKIGPLNFYPTKSTIFKDGGNVPLPERGLNAFIELCKAQKFGPGENESD